MITIFTDGSCLGNPGPGGWAAVILKDGFRQELRGFEENTTNNRMEIMAAIKGLEQTPVGAEVAIRTDSRYLVNTMRGNWRRRANFDLWEALESLTTERKVSFEWLKGHAGQPEHERANAIASEMACSLEGKVVPTHFDESGVHMVDVTAKPVTERIATARGRIAMKPATLELIKRGGVKKGNVLAVAQIAGIMAAKQTHQLIPLCHPLPLSSVELDLEANEQESTVDISATVKTSAQTGVEMEALTAVAVAALTVYDMCKAVDRSMSIEGVRLARKSGGRSGDIVLE